MISGQRLGFGLGLMAAAGLAACVTGAAWAQDRAPVQPDTPVLPAADSPLEWESVEHDFGRIMDTEVVEHVFKFRNKGGATVTLLDKKPQTSCGCTVPELTKLVYAPGEAGEIKVTFNPAGKAGHRNTQKVTIRYRDESKPEVRMPEATLTIHADVKTSVSIEPTGMVNFGDVVQGDVPAPQVVTVTGRGEEFAVTYASVARSRLFGVKVLDTEAVEVDGESLRRTRLEVSLKETPRKGTMQSLATFRTTDKQIPLTSVQVQANVVGDLNILPPRLSTGTLDPELSWQRMIRVISRKKRAFSITNIEQTSASLPSPLEFDLSPLEQSEGAGYQIIVKGVAPKAIGPFAANLLVHTDVPGEEQVEIQVIGSVRQPQPIVLPPQGSMGPTLEPPRPNVVMPNQPPPGAPERP